MFATGQFPATTPYFDHLNDTLIAEEKQWLTCLILCVLVPSVGNPRLYKKLGQKV